MWVLLSRFGLGRFLAWIAASFSRIAVLSWIIDKFGVFWSYSYSLIYNLWPAFFDQVTQGVTTVFAETARAVSAPVVFVLSKLMGLPISSADIDASIEATQTKEQREAMGDPIATLIESIFDEQSVAQGYQVRLPGEAERLNFRRFIGTNLRVQIGSILTDVAKERFPSSTMSGLGNVGERIEKALGFEDAQEEILEPLMEKCIVEGMQKRFNRIIQPTDLTPGDAIDAYIRRYIGEQTLTAILNNEGIRDDVRPVLLKLKGKNLTEADFQDLYQHGLMTAAEVFDAFRENGYLEPDATVKENLVVNARLWKLQTELMNVRETQFAHGVIGEADFRTFLQSLSYTAEEEDIEIEIAKGKASLRATTRPKQITGTFNVAPARVKPGAAAIMTWNIRNAEQVVITDLGSVGPRGERVLYPDISKTYFLDATSDTDSERFEAVVVVGDTKELKRPTASFSASPGRTTIGTQIELKWTTNNADSVSIDGIGPVAESGAMIAFPLLTTIYTLRATNAAGTTVRQDVVFVSLPTFGQQEAMLPQISFTITPGVVKASQPQSEIKWSVSNGNEHFLIAPDGTREQVNSNETRIITSSESGVWTLEATNGAGTARRQEAVIFQGADSE